MKITSFTPYAGGTVIVAMQSAVSIPDRIAFQFSADKIVDVDFWLVQTIRGTIEMYDVYPDDKPSHQTENKIQFIKAIRRIYSLGLKESKDIAEWFMENVDRSAIPRI